MRGSGFAVLILGSVLSIPARADTVLVDEVLDDQHCDFAHCTVSEGAFDSDGWRVVSSGSRLVFDLSGLVPDGIPCGEVSLEFFEFDPIHSGHTGEYVNFLGLYEDDHGNNWDAAGADEAQLQFQGTCDQCEDEPDPWRDYRIKFKAGPCDWDIEACDGENTYLPPNNQYDIDWAATMDVHYTASAAWNCTELAYALTDGSHSWSGGGDWSWHAHHATSRPHFRYLFVGRDHSPGSSRYIDGAVYVHVQVVQHDECDCGDDDDDDASDDDTGPADDDDSASGGDDDTGPADDDDSGSAGDDDMPHGDPEEEGGGCGCRQDGRRVPVLALVLTALVLVARRRSIQPVS